MQTVAEMPLFTKQAAVLFDEEEKESIIDLLSVDPECGDIIPGTGGVRKVRFALPGRGKRGGARLVYYYLDDTIPLLALAVYAKNKKIDLSPDEKKAMVKLTAAIKAAARR
ncbi:MAG: type II toxin-antitoxin system RelE/ParE family toxin [Cognatishimia activa]